MENFFTKNLDVVFFIYGMGFFIMGTAILLQPRRKSEFKLADILWLFAAFCFTHGLNEFLDMWAIIKGSKEVFDLIRFWILTVSYFFFFEFGRRLLRMVVPKTAKLLPSWLSFFVGVIIVLVIVLYPNDWDTITAITRYFLGFPGGILTGSGLFLYYYFNREVLDDIKMRRYFLGAAIPFFAYGVLGGLIVPKGRLFFSGWLNTDSFLLLVKFPVQVFRAFCILVSTWAVCGILRIFNWEEEKDRRIKLAEYAKMEMITNELRGIVSIADELIACVDPDVFFKMAVEFCREKLGIERCAIFLKEDGYMVGTYGTDKSGHTVDEHAQRFPKDATWDNRCRMIKTGEPKWFVVEEPCLEWDGTKVVQIGYGQIVVTPIQSVKGVIGVFVNDMVISKVELSLINQDMLAVFASLLGDIVERKRVEELIESHAGAIEIVNKELHSEIANRVRLEAELRTLSLTDSLSGLYNHRGFLVLATQQMKEAKRNQQDVVLLFADLDNLKWINDKLGHQEGDFALAKVADIFRSCFRESDIMARIGGDEFVVLAIQAEKKSASNLIAKLQKKLDDYNAKANRRYPLSLSIGVSFSDARTPCTIDDLLYKADRLMYEQKQGKKKDGR